MQFCNETVITVMACNPCNHCNYCNYCNALHYCNDLACSPVITVMQPSDEKKSATEGGTGTGRPTGLC